MEGHIGLEIEGDGLAVLGFGFVQGEAAIGFHRFDRLRDVFDINAVRAVTHQAEQDGKVGVVAASGQRQRAIDIGTDVVGACQLSGSE